jgi:hypothetical protein
MRHRFIAVMHASSTQRKDARATHALTRFHQSQSSKLEYAMFMYTQAIRTRVLTLEPTPDALLAGFHVPAA